jgi:predicted nuclease of predicted toxin-antitoxin system
MKFLLDQNLPHRAAVLMRQAGSDCLHVEEVDLAHAADHEIIRWSAQENRICITRDADFHALLATSRAATPSVIRIRIEKLTATDTMHLIEIACTRFRDDLASGALVTITPREIRRRLLPIRS